MVAYDYFYYKCFLKLFLQDKEVHGSVKMIAFLRKHSRRLDRAQPDRNCLFRSLSKQLFNSEKHIVHFGRHYQSMKHPTH